MDNNTKDRIRMVKAMEFIARQVNDENVFESWLIAGVADGDITYGDLCVDEADAEELDYYISDSELSDLMSLFLRIMSRAKKSGGLWCGNVLSK